MATYRWVAHDIGTILKNNFDDAEISLVQIIYWIQVVANKLKRLHVAQIDTGAFDSTFSSVAVSIDAKGRKYIDLPVQVMDLPNNSGVKYITYNYETGCCCSGANFNQVYFQPTKVTESHRLYMDEYEKPTPKNPYFYRVGQKIDTVKVNRIYLMGVECIDIFDVEICVMSSLNPKDVCDLDDELPLPDEMIADLQQEVLRIGKFMLMIPEERINEGSDASEEPSPYLGRKKSSATATNPADYDYTTDTT